MARYLIIGNSAGGLSAVEAIREIDKEGSITILSQEPYPAYSRPRLTQFLAGECTEDDLRLRPPQHYQAHGIELRLGFKAQSLDVEAREVITAGGERLVWDKLLLATGGTPVLTPEWANREGIFTFNSLDETKAVIRALSRGNRVAVIGAGLIGVSAAKALVRRGAQVTLIVGSPRVLSTFLDEEASALAEKALIRGGVRVITQSGGERIERGSPLNVALGNGKVLPVDLVIVGRGVRPNLELVHTSPIQAEEGIVVDRHMETSVADIFACGDGAQAYDPVYGQNRVNANWPNAFMGGRVAGYNMVGKRLTFAGISFNSLSLFGLPVMAAGQLNPDNGGEALYRRSQGVYKKLLLREGRLMGMVMVGDIDRSGIIVHLIRETIQVEAFQQSLLADDFGLASLPAGLRHQLWERAKIKNEEATAV